VPQLTMKKEITVIRDGERSAVGDEVVVEAPLTIYLNGQELVTLLCTPDKKESLALGFLRSGGLLSSLDEVAGVRMSEDGNAVEVTLKNKSNLVEQLYGKHTITSGGGKGVVFFSALDVVPGPPVPEGGISITAEEICSLMSSLQESAAIFKATGGVHSAALADTRKIIIFCEDIGRHNAVDKIIGQSLLQGIPLHDKVLVCSGRLGSEILLKAAKLQLPLLISRAAPTTLSIELAESLNITLVGFVRDRRMNIYTHPHRVKK